MTTTFKWRRGFEQHTFYNYDLAAQRFADFLIETERAIASRNPNRRHFAFAPLGARQMCNRDVFELKRQNTSNTDVGTRKFVDSIKRFVD
ncbi:hypothetical protein GM658_14220 [Pseudoduganella eburnea]|uniref:Uncharacterized protein n=1 Tax=Massilia eburnea TaxID=1776165 RepID=A0A6L6QGY6_9BURK|nr:hypothetical protein [Massilia eburnea]MTW11758.1 hypothetical protein [Massilia eburnea]